MSFFDFLPWIGPERITFPYRRRMILDPTSARPVARFVVQGRHAQQEVQFLVDSGADVTAFPVSYAELFGIRLDRSKKIDIVGVARESIAGYKSRLHIKIGKDFYSIRVYFVDNSFMPLLGRLDVWKHFSIQFDNKAGQVVFEKV